MATAAEKIVGETAVSRPLRMPARDIVRALVEIFGAKLVAVMGNVKNTRTVRHWLQGEKQPDEIDRLRLALQVAFFLQAAGEADDVIDAWFRGMNLRLHDESPALVVADHPIDAARRDLMSAARSFVAQ